MIKEIETAVMIINSPLYKEDPHSAKLAIHHLLANVDPDEVEKHYASNTLPLLIRCKLAYRFNN